MDIVYLVVMGFYWAGFIAFYAIIIAFAIALISPIIILFGCACFGVAKLVQSTLWWRLRQVKRYREKAERKMMEAYEQERRR